jgi:hypothetical protein
LIEIAKTFILKEFSDGRYGGNSTDSRQLIGLSIHIHTESDKGSHHNRIPNRFVYLPNEDISGSAEWHRLRPNFISRFFKDFQRHLFKTSKFKDFQGLEKVT